jgi:hypothetical protein
MPRGVPGMGRVATTWWLATLMIESVHEHQLVTRTYLSFGETATNLGTSPTSMTWSMRKVAVLMR